VPKAGPTPRLLALEVGSPHDDECQLERAFPSSA
jgi:hypothetical protein